MLEDPIELAQKKVVDGKMFSADCHGCRKEDCLLHDGFQSSQSLNTYLQAQTISHYKSREVVFHEGSSAESVYILLSGSIKISMGNVLGNTRIFHLISAHHTPCAILDIAALHNRTHTMNCETLTPCKICSINKTTFQWLMRHEPKLAHRMYLGMSAEVDRLMAYYREETSLQSRERLARLLLRLSNTHGASSSQGIDITLSLRRQELADIIGVTKETVVRFLREWHQNGFIALNGSRICILSENRLRTIASQTTQFTN